MIYGWLCWGLQAVMIYLGRFSNNAWMEDQTFYICSCVLGCAGAILCFLSFMHRKLDEKISKNELSNLLKEAVDDKSIDHIVLEVRRVDEEDEPHA